LGRSCAGSRWVCRRCRTVYPRRPTRNVLLPVTS
jgi:hypothetical protein